MKQLAFQVGSDSNGLIPNPFVNSSNPFRYSGSLGLLISTFFQIAIVGAGVILLIWLIMSAIQWMTSQGDKESLAKARTRITSAIIGFVIIILAYSIDSYIQTVLQPQNVNLQNVDANAN